MGVMDEIDPFWDGLQEISSKVGMGQLIFLKDSKYSLGYGGMQQLAFKWGVKL